MPSFFRVPHLLRVMFRRIRRHPSGGMRLLGWNILLAALVGVAAGVGAVIFHGLSELVAHLTLLKFTGFPEAGAAHTTKVPLIEWLGLTREGPSVFQPLWLLLFITLGGLASGLLVYGLAPEAEGHGTDAAISAFHNHQGFMRARVPIIKTIASAITLGTGGSGGREGPIAQIGAGFASFLGTKLKLPKARRRLLLAAGIGAGIGSIFHAPLAGGMFSVEVLYLDPDFETEALIPSFIATTVAYAVFAGVLGPDAYAPLFHVGENLAYTRPFQLMPLLALLAGAMALAATVYVHAFYGVQGLFRRLPISRLFKPALGALLAGVVGVVCYYLVGGWGEAAQRQALGSIHIGYGFLQHILDPREATIPLVVLLVVGGGKILATSLTIGSGGSGGVFGPSVVIGGSLGSLIGAGFHAWLPSLVGQADVVVFAILGMAGFFAAAAKIPVSTLIMVTEMTAGYALLAPAMWVCALAYIVSGRRSIYGTQKNSRLDSPAHASDLIVDVLKGLTVRDGLTARSHRFQTVRRETPLSELDTIIAHTLQDTFPVVDEHDRYVGLIRLNDVRQYLYESEMSPLAIAQDLARPRIDPISLDMDLSDAIDRFAQHPYEELPVVAPRNPDQLVALLRRQDLITEYDRRLQQYRSP